MTTYANCWLMVTVLLAMTTAAAAGQQDRRRLAITNPAEADADFAYQGEYVGWLLPTIAGRDSRYAGLQVVALGDGEFDAVLLPGGLPGAGWTGEERLTLSGKRRDEVLELEGTPFSVSVSAGTATVRDADGRVLGRLANVERTSPTLGRSAPPEAIVLFEGTETDLLRRPHVTRHGLLREGAEFRDPYRDFSLHLEFLLPYMPHARGQGRANSGVYLQRRYEVQILDSFGLEGASNECGALYRFRAPDVNMCFPPLVWQTYDIQFRAARFDEEGEKVENARVTVWHNGVMIHNDVELEGPTGAGRPESPEPFATYLQDHGNPVHFWNIWLVDHEQYPDYPARDTTELAALDPTRPPAATAPGHGPFAFAPPGAVPGWPAAAVPVPVPVPVPGPVFYHYPPVYYQPALYPAGHPSTYPYPPVQAAYAPVYHQPAVYPAGHPSTVPYPPAMFIPPAILAYPTYQRAVAVSPVPIAYPPGMFFRP